MQRKKPVFFQEVVEILIRLCYLKYDLRFGQRPHTCSRGIDKSGEHCSPRYLIFKAHAMIFRILIKGHIKCASAFCIFEAVQTKLGECPKEEHDTF